MPCRYCGFSRVSPSLGVRGEIGHEEKWVSGGMAPRILTTTLGGAEQPASLPGRFIYVERAPGTQCIGGWMGPGAGLDAVE
jgi:hypothetical protein